MELPAVNDAPLDANKNVPPTDTKPAARRSGIRWWPAAVIVLVGGGAIAYAQLRWPDEATWRDAYTMIAGMAIAFFLVVWWVFLSRAHWKTRTFSGLAVLGVVGLLAALVTVDERSGSMVPRLRWRWAKTAEERAIDYFAAASTDGVATPAVDPGDDGADDGLRIDETDWPGFRGPRRDGVVRGTAIRTDWNARPPRPLWRHPVGIGWSSFAVVDGLAYTQEQRGENEVVVCYDVQSGEQIWLHADESRFVDSQGGDGPRATPTIFDGRLYALGATGLLNCLDPLTGDVLWSTNVLEDAGTGNLIWGMCGSPLVYDDVVVVNPGLNDNRGTYAVVAYDRISGSPTWTAGDTPAAYCAPRLETIDGVRQVLIFDAAGLGGYDAEQGTELWRFPWVTFSRINVAQPIVHGERDVLIASGYSGSTKAGCTRLTISHTGDDWTVEQVYEKPTQLKLKFQSAVLKGDHVYGLDDGILACLEFETGRRVWKDRAGTYGFGQLLLVGEHILVTNEKSGEVALVRATPERFEEVARFQALGEDETSGIVWNHPVLWNGLLLVRNAKEAACYDLRP
jgi:outer membrane protein assembly factor BamB